MFQRPLSVLFASVGVFLVVLVGACSGPETLQSRSMSQAPSIDGALDDWDGELTYVDDQPVSVGVVPTDSLLYVAVAIQDAPLIRSVVSNGLIVWVDPSGGQERTYGIQYPLGLRAQQANAGAAPTSEGASPLGIDDVSLSELAVLQGDSMRQRIPARFSSGLRAEATLNLGSLVYELAIPVGEDGADIGEEARRYGMQAALGETVGIGLHTPEPDDDEDLEGPEEQGIPSVTGTPGQRRPRPGRQQGRQPPPSPPSEDVPTLDVWMRVVSGAGQ